MTAFPESHRDLLDVPVAALATLRADGFPQITESLVPARRGRAADVAQQLAAEDAQLRARPQCSIQLLDLSNPDRYLEVRGLGRIEDDPDYVFAARLAAKYGGLDLSEIDGPGESRVAVTIEPVNVYPVDVGWVLAGEPPPAH
ncbi:MAG TPA: pyridoxamine 5'-phosphate oxidase family protein [Solirubrobacteraceae bacterium]|jgi:hypothetical protein|nr:pyridoxamine 5'-phosphate oxidase family protein [Solirubrobacteraceae bacterium]